MKEIKNKINEVVADQLGREIDIDTFKDTTSKTGNLLFDMITNLSNGNNELAEKQLHDFFIEQSRAIHASMMAQLDDE